MDYRPPRQSRILRQHGYYARRLGSIAILANCSDGYPLPAGLEAGDRVKIISFHYGYYAVEKDGKRFTVFMANIVDRVVVTSS